MIMLNVLNCLKSLTLLHKFHEKEYEMEESKRSPDAKRFFYVRSSLLSYMICKDALTDAFVEAADELEDNLRYLQDLHKNTYNEDPKVYVVTETERGPIVA